MGLFRPNKKEKTYLASLDIHKLLEQDFQLTIDDIFTIVAVGTTVTGVVQSGMCRINEDAIVEKMNGEKLNTRITYVDFHGTQRKNNNCGYRTEHIGIGLYGIKKEQLQKGDKIIIKNANKYRM